MTKQAKAEKRNTRVILNRIQDLQRLPLWLRTNMRGRCQIKFGMTSLFNHAGFTLIELLVVVLIIGILAAIALPQYQKAVAKTRLSNMKNLLATIARAEEIYYMEHGKYAEYVAFGKSKLDIDLSQCHSSWDDNFYCDDYFWISPIDGNGQQDSQQHITAYYCPGNVKNSAGIRKCQTSYDFYYRVYLKHSSNPNSIECIAQTAFGRTICNSL